VHKRNLTYNIRNKEEQNIKFTNIQIGIILTSLSHLIIEYMNKRLSKPLIPPLSGRWARMGLTLLFSTAAIALNAQKSENPSLQWRDRGKAYLSIYAQGGLSWATDVWYQNIDAKKSYKQSPAAGGGIDVTIRPWVRVGGEYIWSQYRREQRFSTLDTRTMPVKTYGKYMMNFHNAKLGVGFNFMEIWPRRRAQWFNIWVGTGVGYTFARGNEYGIYISSTQTQNGTTSPLTEVTVINNSDAVSINSNVSAQNRHEHFNNLYVPASLHIEADVTRRLTVGLKGEMDWLINRKDIAPKNLIFGLATVRYNFVPSRAKMQKAYYDGEIASYNDRVNALQREVNQARSSAEVDRAKLQQENADLQNRLSDCENSKPEAAAEEQPTHFVQFDHNSSYMSRSEIDRLKIFARSVKGQRLSLVAEASTPGTKEYNQTISEKRLKRVMDALIKEGFAPEDLRPTTAIGSQNGKPSAEGRRVTISVEK